MKVKKSIITSLRPQERLNANGIVGKSEEMNERIERNISITEEKITMGMRRAEVIQTN